MATSKMDTRRVGRSRRTIGAALATCAMLLSVGLAAPAATAVEPDGADSYDLVVGGQATTLGEGQSVTIPLQSGRSKAGSGLVTPQVTYPGNAGTLTVTAQGGSYYWSIATPCVGNGLGTFHVTDLTSGMNGGFTPAYGYSGSAPTSRLRNHRYSGTLDLTITNFWGTCAYTGPNATLYTYTG